MRLSCRGLQEIGNLLWGLARLGYMSSGGLALAVMPYLQSWRQMDVQVSAGIYKGWKAQQASRFHKALLYLLTGQNGQIPKLLEYLYRPLRVSLGEPPSPCLHWRACSTQLMISGPLTLAAACLT